MTSHGNADEASRPALDIRNLVVAYRRRGRMLRIINDVSLHIQRGEAYGLVGESGCGKSTIAMAVMRYLPANAVVEAGEVFFRQNDDLLRAGEARLRELRGNRIAMVYQDPGSALNPAMTIGRQIAEVYRYHRNMNKAEAMQAAAAMLETVQIPDAGRVLRRYPHQLSGGQQQRIMFAMAFATNPELLVLDEPTTGLDATVEAEVLDLVARLRSELDTSILFISHNLGIVARICERVGVLYAGRLIEEGPSAALFSEPRHPYTLALLRCVPRAGMRKDEQRLDSIRGSLPLPGSVLSGCVYAERCPLARARCLTELPPEIVVASGRVTRCFFHEEVGGIAVNGEKALPRARRIPGDPLLQVENAGKIYRSGGAQTTAVADVTFSVGRGETLGIVGESGSGKSSLAKCIAGLAELSKGRIRFAGAELADIASKRSPEQRRKLQLIFQNPDTSLNPRHTVRHILGRAIRLLTPGLTRAEVERRLLALAAAVRLQPRHLDLRPGSLSGGLKQRVAVARAFAGSPSLVVCDEPTSALDVSVQAAILNLLVDLQTREQASYIFISHDLGVVRYLADRIVVMYLAQVVEIGSAAAVFNPPHHPYTEALLSAMPALDAEDRRVRIQLDGAIPSPSNPPSGCRFHTRCPRVLGEVCRVAEPPWREDGEGHLYRCHIVPADLRRMQADVQAPVVTTS